MVLALTRSLHIEYILVLHINEAGWPKLAPAEQKRWMAAYEAYT